MYCSDIMLEIEIVCCTLNNLIGVASANSFYDSQLRFSDSQLHNPKSANLIWITLGDYNGETSELKKKRKAN